MELQVSRSQLMKLIQERIWHGFETNVMCSLYWMRFDPILMKW